jgi:hypothetical protein
MKQLFQTSRGSGTKEKPLKEFFSKPIEAQGGSPKGYYDYEPAEPKGNQNPE